MGDLTVTTGAQGLAYDRARSALIEVDLAMLSYSLSNIEVSDGSRDDHE